MLIKSQQSAVCLLKKLRGNVMSTKLSVTMTKSRFGRLPNHQACLKGLGLRKINQTVVVLNTPENKGMINKVSYMLKVEEI
jgi:large subunit ribosomal protein L30